MDLNESTGTATEWAEVPRPNSYEELFKYYGNPFTDPNFESKYIVTRAHVIGGGQTINVRCHIAVADKVHNALADIVKGNMLALLNEYDGAFVVRNIRGSTHPSLHSWGLAIDFDASKYPLGSNNRLPHDIIVAFKNQGFFYGGDFHHRLDPMHFEYTGGSI